MFGKLAPCSGGRPIPLFKRKLVVGRHRSCDIPLLLPTVSSRHCELELTEGYWRVHDLDSSNGTCVNGKACKTEWLWPNDVLWLASYRYTVIYEAPEGRPPPQRAGVAAGVESTSAKPIKGTFTRPQPTTTMPSPCLGKLIPCGGGPPIPLYKPKIVIGRLAGCDVVLRCNSISGRHCQLEWTGGGWVARDLQSRNGIRVDGVRCETQRLASGSILWVGGLRFELLYTPHGAPSSPATKGPTFVQSLLEKAGLSRLPAQSFSLGLPRGAAEDESRERYSLDDSE